MEQTDLTERARDVEPNVDKEIKEAAGDFKGLEPLNDTPVAPAHGIAAIALNMAMKYHDIGMIKDGALYQQYKLEGRNFVPLELRMVFETAEKIEVWLLGASDRIAKVIVEAIEWKVDEEKGEAKSTSPDTASP